jgi:hypothetical protein
MNGFPVGEDRSLTHVALTFLPHCDETSLDVLPLFNLRSGPQILAACRELKPDAVVLQLGHYESPSPLRESLGWREKKRPLVGDVPVPWRPRPELQYRPTFSMMCAKLKRISVAALSLLMGKRKKMFNAGAIAVSLDSILNELKKLPLRTIVVVGPFSAPDPLTRFCRRKIVPIFEAAANKHGCTFVDVFSVLESYPKGKAFRSNFADAQHLSVVGHQRVGAAVGQALKLALENAGAADGVASTRIQRESRTQRSVWVQQPVVAPRSQSMGAV